MRPKVIIIAAVAFACALAAVLFAALRPVPPCFSLTARLDQPTQSHTPLSLIIELKNLTTRPQHVIVPPGRFFWGSVTCRDSNGVSHTFCHTNILGFMTTVMFIEPFDLAPGGTRQWRHSLTDFVALTPGTNSQPPVFRFLDQEFRPGGELWCEFRVAQESIYKTTASLSSAKIGYLKPKPLNQSVEANRRPASPLNGNRWVESVSYAPPFLPAAVAHLPR